MSKFLIKNGRVINPGTHRDTVADVFIVDDTIAEVDHKKATEDVKVIDATGKWVIPGVVDMHVHLRDFEESEKETVETGTLAARKGGVTTVVAMPNTKPPLDGEGPIKKYYDLITKNAKVNVLVAGAISKGLKGKELTDLANYYFELGVKVVTDDGKDVDDEKLLEKAYKKAKEYGLILMTHAEMAKGSPKEKEWKAVERGIKLAIKTGARAHFTHLSTKESIDLIRQAKKESHLVTCDVTPHHFTFTEKEVEKSGPFAKVNPPLRAEEDRLAVIEGIRDGTVDAIVTDHAPHRESDKKDFATAAFGISGLETLIPATLTELHFRQGIDLLKIIGLLTVSPAKILNIEAGHLQTGYDANVVVIDPDLEKIVDRMQFVSKGKNTPFHGMKLKGWPTMTFYNGVLNK